MESLYLLIPLVLVAIAGAVRLLIWAINSGQYDDLDKEGQRILFDEPEKPESNDKEQPAKRSATADESDNSNPKVRDS